MASHSHRLYSTWWGMKQRCHYPKAVSYPNYGARGIVVCAAWQTFAGFLVWAENSNWQAGLQRDRIDNDGPYSPENCKWSTLKENSRNKRSGLYVTAFGETKSAKDWSEDSRCAVVYTTLHYRLRYRNWPPELAITTPKQK